MNKILEKFSKKVEKIKKFIIVSSDEDNLLLSAPVGIEKTFQSKNRLACNVNNIIKVRLLPCLILFTTKPDSPFARRYDAAGVCVQLLTAKGKDNTVEALETEIPLLIFEHARLHTYKDYDYDEH